MMRVLFVEDHSIGACGTSLVPKSNGAVTDRAGSGEEALDLARHYEYDVVLSDIMLPDIEGFEVVGRMRLARNDTAALIMSGMGQ